MAESNLQIIENAKKRIAKTQKKIVRELGHFIWTNYKLPDTDIKGNPIKYNNGNTKMRKLNDVTEFKDNFNVVKANGTPTKKSNSNINKNVASAVDLYAKNYNVKNDPDTLAKMLKVTAGFANDPTLIKLYKMMITGNFDVSLLKKLIQENTPDNSDNDGTNSDKTEETGPNQDDPDNSEEAQ